MEGNNENVDVGSVVEAVSADDGDAPLYHVESLCMRCGQNVFSLFFVILAIILGLVFFFFFEASLSVLLSSYLKFCCVSGYHKILVDFNSSLQKGISLIDSSFSC